MIASAAILFCILLFNRAAAQTSTLELPFSSTEVPISSSEASSPASTDFPATSVAESSAVSSGTPSPTDDRGPLPTGNVTANYKLYGFVGCSQPEKNAIYDSLDEKHTILYSHGLWNVDWNSKAAVDFFGCVHPGLIQLTS
jgi:hypothetical protein